MNNWKKTLAEETLAFLEGGELGREAYRAAHIAEAEELGRIRARAEPAGVEVKQYPETPRLVPRTQWQGGRVSHKDVLELLDAASMASLHAGQTVTVKDFLRAAGRGEIPMHAIVHQSAKTEPCRAGDALWNEGKPVPKGSIPTLPLSACKALAITGRAAWRTFDWLEQINGMMMRLERWKLAADEPDFETTPDDCRVMVLDVHALADTFKDETQPQPQAQAAPESATAPRRSLWNVVTPYIVETMQAGQYASAKELFKALEKKSGPDSPFDKGTGNNRDGLFVRETAKALSLKTLQNKWPELLKAAKK